MENKITTYSQMLYEKLTQSRQWYFDDDEKYEVVNDGKGTTYILWKDEAIDFDDLYLNVVMRDFEFNLMDEGLDQDEMTVEELQDKFWEMIESDESIWVYLDIEYRWLKEVRN